MNGFWRIYVNHFLCLAHFTSIKYDKGFGQGKLPPTNVYLKKNVNFI